MRAVLLGTAVALAALPGAARADFTTYQGDPAHDGELPGETVPAQAGIRWSAPLPGYPSYPVIAGGRVFVTSSDYPNDGPTTVAAFDLQTGAALWSDQLAGSTGQLSNLAYDAGRVYVAEAYGSVIALDAASGAQVWSAQLPDDWPDAPPVAFGGLVYVTSSTGPEKYPETGHLTALRETDGGAAWSRAVRSGSHSSPTSDGHHVYLTYEGPDTYAFDAADGSVVWAKECTDPSCDDSGGSTSPFHAGRLYSLATPQRSGAILDASNGAQIGSFASGPTPAFGLGERFENQDALVAIDEATENVLWRYERLGAVATLPPLVAGSDVLTVDNTGTVADLDAASGSPHWACATGLSEQPPDEGNWASPLSGFAVGDGTVVVSGYEGIAAVGAGGRDCNPDQPSSQPAPAPAGTSPSGPSGTPGATTGASSFAPGAGLYAGGRRLTHRDSGSLIGIARNAGSVATRIMASVKCRNIPEAINLPVFARGALSGESFTATGRTSPIRRMTMLLTVTGTFAGDVVRGNIAARFTHRRGGPRRCHAVGIGAFTARAQPQPAGAPQRPTAGGQLLYGMSAQPADGVPQPVLVEIGRSAGKVRGVWSAFAPCPHGVGYLANVSPFARVGASGGFVRDERFVIRYDNGVSDHFRVHFAGRMLADGATGRLRLRIVTRSKHGAVLARCDSGPQGWTAAPLPG